MKKILITSLLFCILYYVNAQNTRATVLQDLEKEHRALQETKITATLKSASRLFGDKGDLTTVILIIPSGSEVEVTGSDSTYLSVIFEDYEGYIFRRQATINELPVVTKPSVQQQKPNVEQEAAPRQQVSRFTYLERKYGSSMAAKLNEGKVWKGMTSEMVSDSWGTPRKINRVISGNIVKEEWIFSNTWLYIENDILVEWGPIRK